MSKETLKTLRIMVPGAMALIIFLPMGQRDFSINTFGASLASMEGLVYLAAVCGFGALYYILDFRSYFIRASLEQIRDNIKDHMLQPCIEESEIAVSSENLRMGRTLIQIFYHFVDKDESLKEKAKSVYLNGLIWSSTADFMAIGAVGVALYCAGYFFLARKHYLVVALLLAIGHLVAGRLLMPRVTAKHISLSNEQLEYIRLYYRDELCDRLKKAATEIRRDARITDRSDD